MKKKESRINLNERSGNYKMLMKEIEDINEKILCSWIEKLILLKYPQYSKIYEFSAILVKIPAAFFTEMEKNNPQICMEPHTQKNKTQISKSILRKNKAAGMTLPEFKLCCEGIAFKTEREVGGGIGMGNTCKSMADSCQCMTKTTTVL